MEETIQVISESVQQSSFFIEHIDTVVTVLTTVIGFVVTYLLTKKSFKNEIKKSKITLAAEQIQTLPYDICQFMDAIIKKDNCDMVKEYGSILSKVLAYGSSQSVKIAIKMQRMSYGFADISDLDDKLPLLAAYSLLITQLKFDLTSEIISPESWFQLRMNDYEKIRTKMCKSINDLIKELDLNNAFKV